MRGHDEAAEEGNGVPRVGGGSALIEGSRYWWWRKGYKSEEKV